MTVPLPERLKQIAEVHKTLKDEIGKTIVGQEAVIDQVLIAILARGHCLLLGVPGLAKTLLVRSLGEVLDLGFNRVQFTPDLMPSDITGTEILDEESGSSRRTLRFVQGPVFTNLLLADEINRTPPKTQAALLEAMQENVVTTGGKSFPLPQPFFVLATQNPIEQEGTYPLPEAQVDRFMLKVVIGYPDKKEEKLIIRQNISNESAHTSTILKTDDIMRARAVTREVYLDEKIENYITDIVFASRFPGEFKLKKFEGLISYGASPRASINLALASKAYAFIKRRGYVIPEDVRAIANDVMRHRIGLTYEAEAENITTEDIINEILNTIEVP